MNFSHIQKREYYWAALLLVGFNLWHSCARGIWNLSILDSLTIGTHTIELAKKIDPRIRPWKSYDGQFFYAMTFDPLLISKESVKYIDSAIYRYRRMLYPLLGYLFAFGQPQLFPYSLFFVNIIAWLLVILALWKIAKLENLPRAWLALAGLCTTGITYATFRTLCDTLSMAFVLWGCYLWRSRCIIFSATLFAFASLTRETAMTVPLTIFIYSAYRKDEKWLKMFAFGIIAALPPILWWIYVTLRLPGMKFPDIQYLTLPFLGIFKETLSTLHQTTSFMEHKRTLSIVIVTVPLILSVLFSFWRFPTFWGALALGQGLFCSIVQGGAWVYHAGSVRVIIPLTIFSIIWFFELAYSNRSPTSLKAVS